MKQQELEIGDVVQLSPEVDNSFFRGCFMLVTEVKPWGAQGFIAMPESRDKLPGSAYYRARWDQMEKVGKAFWAPAAQNETETESAEETR